MSQTKYIKDIASDNILARIAKATGVDNKSDTSVARLIGEATTEDVLNFKEYVDEMIDGSNTLYAQGKRLDKKALDSGISRKKNPKIYIDASDMVAVVKVTSGSGVFGDYIGSEVVIPEGGIIETPSGVRLRLSRELVLGLNGTEVGISGVISTSTSSLDIPNGSLLKFPTEMTDENQGLKLLSIEFRKPIYIKGIDDSDSGLRERLRLHEIYGSGNSLGSIVRTMMEIPGISDFEITEGRRPGIVSIGFITEQMARGEDDILAQMYIDIINTEVGRGVMSLGAPLDVFIPKPIDISIEWSIESSVPDEIVTAAIYEYMISIKKYSQGLTLTKQGIIDSAMAISPEVYGLQIPSIGLYDETIDEMISFYSEEVPIPNGRYLRVKEVNITRTEE